MGVLLLDCTYEPIEVISWELAMHKVITGDAEVLEEVDQPVRSQKQEWKMPSVIRQLRKFKRGKDVQFSRINIYMRDDWTCQYCLKKKGTRELTFDHVVPRCQGGQTNWKNIVTACRKCNDKKADKSIEQAGLKLAKNPEKPKWLPQQMIINVKHIPKEWEPYIDLESFTYWKEVLER